MTTTPDAKSNHDLNATLETLLKLHASALEDYDAKREEVSRIQKELSDAGILVDNLTGTVRVVQGQLGIPESERLQTRFAGRKVDGRSVIQIVLEIIAEHNTKGGVTRAQVIKAAREQGAESAEDYYSAVFYRLQHRRNKIKVVDHRWFLTDETSE